MSWQKTASKLLLNEVVGVWRRKGRFPVEPEVITSLAILVEAGVIRVNDARQWIREQGATDP